MKVPFEQASYLSQVRRLRALSQEALRLYPLRVEDCRLLGHAENTTFRVTANRGRKFLLRIHRNGYHTRAAILEELRWLQDLSSSILVPKPVQSRQHQLLETVESAAAAQTRHCTVVQTLPGHSQIICR